MWGNKVRGRHGRAAATASPPSFPSSGPSSRAGPWTAARLAAAHRRRHDTTTMNPSSPRTPFPAGSRLQVSTARASPDDSRACGERGRLFRSRKGQQGGLFLFIVQRRSGCEGVNQSSNQAIEGNTAQHGWVHVAAGTQGLVVYVLCVCGLPSCMRAHAALATPTHTHTHTQASGAALPQRVFFDGREKFLSA